MIYYALVKRIYKDKAFVASFDIDVSFVVDDLETLALSCEKYDYDVNPSRAYEFNHPGGTIAIDRASGIFNAKYTTVERECDEFMTEYAINKAAINTENERLSTNILNNRGHVRDSFLNDCRIIQQCWTR